MLRQGVKLQNLVTRATQATSVNDTALTNEFDFDSIVFRLNASAVTGTTPTLDVVIQTSLDGGTTWLDVVRFAQITAATTNAHFATAAVLRDQAVHGAVGDGTIAASAVGVPVLGRNLRVKSTIGGTTPAFTYTVDAYFNHVDTR